MSSSTEEYLEQAKSVIARSVAAPEKLEALIKLHINYGTNCHNTLAGISIFEMKNLPRKLAKSYIAKRDEYEHILRELIQEGMLMGYLRKNDPNMTVRFILGLLNSVIIWFRESGPLSSNEVAEEIWKFIARSVCIGPRDTEPPNDTFKNIGRTRVKKNEIHIYTSPDYPETYGELIDWAVEHVKEPDTKVFFRMSDTEITYSKFNMNVNKTCNLLREAGVQKGDHIAIFLSSCIEYAYLYHALGKLGGIVCPINPFLKGETLQYILKHSDSKYLITSRDLFSEKISNITEFKALKCIFFLDKKEDVKGVDSFLFSDFMKCSSDFEPKWKVTGDDIQGIWYTSGTTGVPKGAVITHKNYLYRVFFSADYFRMTNKDVIYYILPMYHVAYTGWGGPLAMAAGAEIVQATWFSASNFWKDVLRYKATVTFSTGTVIPIMLKQPITEDEIIGKEKLRLWVGWPVGDPKSLTERWPKIKFLEAYGTTEVPAATISDYESPEFGNAGPPTPYTDLKIIDPKSGEELTQGKVGEIVYCHKLGSSYMIKEYYKDPQKTNEVIKNGYWYSGDLGMLDERGHLKFVDRLKDYLRIGGENVSSSVVEETIRKHPAILEVAIVGKRSELEDDEIVAYVVLKEGLSIDPKEFFEFCNEKMAYFMVPKYFVIRSELPKTSTLRIEKYRLREEGVPSNAIDRSKLNIVLKR
jgi:crotonobetaine/carnitine-CoA ligase